MSRIETLKYIVEIKKLSYQELKYLREVTTDENRLKLLELEMNRRIYASN